MAIRRLRRGETALFEQHLLRLDAEGRRRRFGRVVGDRVVSAYARGEGGRPGVVEGAFVDGVLRAVGELRPLGDGAAEVALSVEAAFRRRGIGTALLRRVVLVARNDGIGALTLLCLAENLAMQRMVRRHGGVLVRGAGEVEASLCAAAPTFGSLLREEIAESVARLATAPWVRLFAWRQPSGRGAQRASTLTLQPATSTAYRSPGKPTM